MDNKPENRDIASSFLSDIQRQEKEVSIYLVNGIRLKGFIHKYDKDSILLRNGGIQLIRVDAISTIMPGNQTIASNSWDQRRV